MQKSKFFFAIILFLLISGHIQTVQADEYDYQTMTTVMSVDKPGDYNLGLSVPYSYDEYEVVPILKIRIKYFRNLADINQTNPALTRAKCLFQAEIDEQKESISLPGFGYLLVETIITVVDPVDINLKQGNQNGIDEFSSREWNDMEKNNSLVENKYMIIDLSSCPSYLDVMLSLVHEEEIEHRLFFFIKFTTHMNIGYVTKSRINILGDTNKLAKMSDAELMGFFNGGFSPKYGTWIDLSMQKPQDRKTTIEEFKIMDGQDSQI